MSHQMLHETGIISSILGTGLEVSPFVANIYLYLLVPLHRNRLRIKECGHFATTPLQGMTREGDNLANQRLAHEKHFT